VIIWEHGVYDMVLVFAIAIIAIGIVTLILAANTARKIDG